MQAVELVKPRAEIVAVLHAKLDVGPPEWHELHDSQHPAKAKAGNGRTPEETRLLNDGRALSAWWISRDRSAWVNRRSYQGVQDGVRMTRTSTPPDIFGALRAVANRQRESKLPLVAECR